MNDPRVFAMAALSISESMLLSLEDSGLLDADERRSLLEDVVDTHLRAAAQGGDPQLHKAIARIANEMLASSNTTAGRGGADRARHVSQPTAGEGGGIN